MDKKALVIQFIKKRLQTESRILFEQGLFASLYVHIAQGIEFIGAFTDDKPLRARDQSRIRFDAAIQEFFPKSYQLINLNSWFYHKYRVHVIHTFLPSSYLFFCDLQTCPDAIHLKMKGEKRSILIDQLYLDYQQALEQLIEGIETGRYPVKMLQGLN